ncbi:Uncharacterized protein APZ42_005304, partial [Daphnia magna]
KPRRRSESLFCCSPLSFVCLLICLLFRLFICPPPLPISVSVNGLRRRRPVTPLFSLPPFKQLFQYRVNTSSNRSVQSRTILIVLA